MWHYLRDNQSVGPVDEAGMIQLIQAGAVTRETQVWKDGMAEWAPVASTPLAQFLVAAPPGGPLEAAPAPAEPVKKVPGWVNIAGGIFGAAAGYFGVKLAFKSLKPETIAMFIGGGVAGLLCGLIPYFVGKKRGNLKLGKIGLWVCVAVGIPFGLLLALPT